MMVLNVPQRRAAASLGAVDPRSFVPWPRIWSSAAASTSYTGGFCEWLRRRLGWRYGLEEKPRGFQVLPRRWVVERAHLRLAGPVAAPEPEP